MAYTETSYQSYFGRIGNSIKGVLFGIIFVPISVIVLFWNEGRAVHTARTLAEGKSSVVSIDSAKVDPGNDRKLVHFTGKAINADSNKLVDPVFKVTDDAIHLRRNVQMYQWKENKHQETHNNTIGGGTSTTTTYTYEKKWSNQPIDSSEFKEAGHNNPGQWRIDEARFDAPSVTVGAFTLDSALASKIDNFTPVDLSSNVTDALPPALKSDAVLSNNTIYFANNPGQKPDPASAQIGDLKVTFEAALPGDVSVIAAQSGSGVGPYQTKNNTLELLSVGNHTAAEMFQAEETKNTQITWILRGVGFVGMWIGLAMLLNPLKVLSDVVGIIGEIVGAGIAMVAGVVAVVISSTTIAIAWITYRPLVGVSLLAVAGGAIVLFFVLRSRRATQRQTIVPLQGAAR